MDKGSVTSCFLQLHSVHNFNVYNAGRDSDLTGRYFKAWRRQRAYLALPSLISKNRT